MLTEFSATSLVSESGRAIIREATAMAAEGVDELRAIPRLRALAPPDVAGAAWELALLRRRAQSRLGPGAEELFFDRDGYEMASAAACSAYHASIFREAGADAVYDPCAGVGIDACRIAHEGIVVHAVERDPARAVFARANARTLGVADRVVVVAGDSTTIDPPPGIGFAFVDPARRDERRRRIVDGDDLAPPLSFIARLAAQGVSSALVKLSPAIERGLGAEMGADTEFLSDGGECKEALLRTGALRTGKPISARLLGPGICLSGPAPSASVQGEPGSFLYEPDPAIIRAGLTGHVAAAVSGRLLDPRIAYVCSNEYVATPLADAYEVEAWVPYRLKRLREELIARGVGKVIVKRRGFPDEPDAVRKALKLPAGEKERIVILTRAGERLLAMIARRVEK